MNFDYFQIQKLLLQTIRPEKQDEKKKKKKKVVICLVSMFPELWSLIYPK